MATQQDVQRSLDVVSFDSANVPILRNILDDLYSKVNAVTGTATTLSNAPSDVWSGIIAMWKGSIATIPSGWVLCDGSNGTPNLRKCFVYGASDGSGAGEASPGEHASSGTLSGNDSAVVYKENNSTVNNQDSGSVNAQNLTNNTNVMPPYYALAYIMKT